MNVEARYNVGRTEALAGNIDRALKHFMIAVEGGYNESLNAIKQMYSNGGM
jgi:TPR repeat protein